MGFPLFPKLHFEITWREELEFQRNLASHTEYLRKLHSSMSKESPHTQKNEATGVLVHLTY